MYFPSFFVSLVFSLPALTAASQHGISGGIWATEADGQYYAYFHLRPGRDRAREYRVNFGPRLVWIKVGYGEFDWVNFHAGSDARVSWTRNPHSPPLQLVRFRHYFASQVIEHGLNKLCRRVGVVLGAPIRDGYAHNSPAP